ncbi:hypothetical protein DCC81_06965 [Chitinophaga parva]|uniref:Uncharacterized protein n=1 Tax=Chitinophaga parva TaxID=2169414 RepID=A0A2T7BND9_9BACT|nr:hypothetical protein DCC81_06965 [Chitinophaga parva]
MPPLRGAAGKARYTGVSGYEKAAFPGERPFFDKKRRKWPETGNLARLEWKKKPIFALLNFFNTF